MLVESDELTTTRIRCNGLNSTLSMGGKRSIRWRKAKDSPGVGFD